MKQLIEKVAIITGASSGIGYEAARLFASKGARLVVTGRRRDALDALVGEIEAGGGEAIALAGDIRDEDLARRLVETTVGRFGGLDIAFNNVGITDEAAPLPDLPLESWREVLDSNLTSGFLCA